MCFNYIFIIMYVFIQVEYFHVWQQATAISGFSPGLARWPFIFKECYIYFSVKVICIIGLCIFIACAAKSLLRTIFGLSAGCRWSPSASVSEPHALHGELLYPTTLSATPDASVGASVGAPQSLTSLCEFPSFPISFIKHISWFRLIRCLCTYGLNYHMMVCM